jgi:hypothetical protein
VLIRRDGIRAGIGFTYWVSSTARSVAMGPGARAVTLITEWRREIEAGVRAMQAQGKIAESVDADRAAAALLAGIQGGVGIVLSTGDLGYLEAALDTGIASLQAQLETAADIHQKSCARRTIPRHRQAAGTQLP